MKCAEREREAKYLFYFFPLNRFQLLFFNLEKDILSFSYSYRTVVMLDVSHPLLILNRIRRTQVTISKYDLFLIYININFLTKTRI
jgi:hypothetical protein